MVRPDSIAEYDAETHATGLWDRGREQLLEVFLLSTRRFAKRALTDAAKFLTPAVSYQRLQIWSDNPSKRDIPSRMPNLITRRRSRTHLD